MIQNAMCEYAELTLTYEGKIEEFIYCTKYKKLCNKEKCKIKNLKGEKHV